MLGALKGFVPGTARYSRKHHVKYLHKKASGHDALLLVEWEDGKLTELGADVHPEMDGWYKATNGLIFAPAGEGVDPVDYYGVPVIRCHSQIACPFSTEACLAADFDEAGEFQYQIDRESETTEQVVEVDMGEPATPDEAGATNGHTNGETAADGGGEMVRSYDLRPPAGAVGYSFSLTQAKQRAPNPISANMVRRAVEYGKEIGRDDGQYMRGLLHGGGLILGTVIILAVLYIAGASILGGGGGGSGGGGGQVLSALLALAGPRVTGAWAEIRDSLAEGYRTAKEHPIAAALAFLRANLAVTAAATLMLGYIVMLMTQVLFWNEYLADNPELAAETVNWFGASTFEAFLGDVYFVAMLGPLAVLLWVGVRVAERQYTAQLREDADAE
jgi:hypothetical protein